MSNIQKTAIGINEILKETDKLLEIAYHNKEVSLQGRVESVLEKLLNAIEKVDFRTYTQLKESTKLKTQHFLVSVIEILIKTAHENGFSLCRKYGFVYVYNGAYWQLVDRSEFEDFLGQVALKMELDRFYAKHYSFKKELYQQFIADARLREIQTDQKTTAINLANGTFEISPFKQALRPHQKEDFLTYQLPFAYDAFAKAPQFQTYLDRVLPELELQDILAEYLSYIFIKNNVLKLEKVLLAYGTGANGKSVLFEIIMALLGSENITNYSLSSLTSENSYSRAMLANKLLNYASEINGKLETNTFKLLVSGEPVEARLPYGKPHLISNYARFMFNCNELPNKVENTNAFFRRFLIIPFRVTIPRAEQDPDLSKRIILSELSGVFNWVLKGLNRLLENRDFSSSTIVKNEVLRYQKESDTICLFLEDMAYQQSVSHHMPLTTIFNEYRSFCIESNYRSESKKSFSQKIQRLGYHLKRKSYGNALFIEKKVFSDAT